MTRTVLLNCPIKAEIRAVDSQSDFDNFVIVMIIIDININDVVIANISMKQLK